MIGRDAENPVFAVVAALMLRITTHHVPQCRLRGKNIEKQNSTFSFSESVSAAVVTTVGRDLDHSGWKGSTRNTRSTDFSVQPIHDKILFFSLQTLSTATARIMTFHWKYKTQDHLAAKLSYLTKSLSPLTHIIGSIEPKPTKLGNIPGFNCEEERQIWWSPIFTDESWHCGIVYISTFLH